MIYVKIGKSKYPCDLQVGKTQFGNDVVRIISAEAPIANNGFKLLDENNAEIADFAEFKNLYREEGSIKEYTKEAEEIIPIECFSMGDVPSNPIQRQISALNARVSAITPYVESKKAYYGEIEKVFYRVPNGNVSVFFDNYDGAYEIVRTEDRVTIKFPERLTDMTNINISVQ